MSHKYLTLFVILIFCQKTFSQAPVINSFIPSSGPIGTAVTIAGSGFSSTISNNVVFFGAVKAVVNTASANSLTVTVPAGATFQPITITVNGLTAFSSKPFNVTFAGGNNIFIPDSFEPKVDYASGPGTTCIAAGDFDGDGKADIVSLSETLNSASVFRNNSSGNNINLDAKIDFITNSKPYCVAVGDIDGNGKLDLIVVNGASNNISLFRNISSGSGNIAFASKIDLPVGTSPYGATMKDFNGDGKPDIGVVNSSNNNISIFKNNSTIGTFSFAAKTDFVTGISPYWVDAGDLDGDGKPDIVTANGILNNSVSVLRNTSTLSTISFDTKIDFDGGNYAYGVSVADVNNDNKTDLIIADGGGSAASVLLSKSTGAGNISFDPKLVLSTGYFSFSAVPADMNGDGKLDIVVGNLNASTVSILKNNLSNSLSFSPHADFAVGNQPWVVLPVDLDGDGKLDIATANYSSGNISVIKNLYGLPPGITSFTPTIAGTGDTIIIKGTNLSSITAVSFGGIQAYSFSVKSRDSIAAIVGTGASGDVSVSNGNDSAKLQGFTYVPPPQITSFSSANAAPGTIVTITGNYFQDVVSVKFGEKSARSFTVQSLTKITAVVDSFSGGAVQVATRYGKASLEGFYNGHTIKSFSPTSGPVGTQVIVKGTGFNNQPQENVVYFGAVKAMVTVASDTSLTVIVPAGSTFQPLSVTCNKLVVFANAAFTQTFPNEQTILNQNSFTSKIDFQTPSTPYKMAVGDMNLDGKPDIVVSDVLVAVYQNTSINGNASFTRFGLSMVGQIISLTDVDGDGLLDILSSNGGQTVYVYKNTSSAGTISFDFPIEVSLGGESIYRIGINDFDQDGKPDIVVPSQSYNSISIYRNTTDRGVVSFEPQLSYPSMIAPMSVNTGDINGDGKPDIVTTNNSNRYSVYINKSNRGIISFDQALYRTSPDGLVTLLMSDINNDGKTDLIAANAIDTSVMVFKNTSSNGNVLFDEPVRFVAGINPYDLAIQDMDGDGKPDISAISIISSKVYILKNSSDSNTVDFSSKIEYETGTDPTGVAAADFNMDGKPDLVVANFHSNSISLYRNKIGEADSVFLCPPAASTNISSGITGTNFQWQVNTGSGFANISNNANYSNSNSSTLQLNNVPSSWSGYQYRCIVDGSNSNISKLTFTDTWTGSVNTAWENAANWSCSAIPDANTDVIINNGNVVINSNVTVSSLKINPGATITVNAGYKLTILH